jgi:heat shock protein HslJ
MKILQTRIILIIIMLLLVILAYRVFIYGRDGDSDLGSSPENTQLDQTAGKIVGIKWVWKQSDTIDETVVSTNDAFTITLSEDGRVQVTTDCNNGQGIYTLGENQSIEFNAIATTKMFCEGSQESEFLSQLSEVDSYTYENDTLILGINSSDRMMEFTLE